MVYQFSVRMEKKSFSFFAVLVFVVLASQQRLVDGKVCKDKKVRHDVLCSSVL